MPHRSLRLASLLLISTLTLTTASRAGELGDFEKSATTTRKGPKPDKARSVDSFCEEDFLSLLLSDMLGEAFAGILDLVFIEGGRMSFARVQPSSDSSVSPLGLRVRGDPDLPYLSADVNFQWVHPDVTAIDVRAEAGYGPFGFQVRETHYTEDRPRDELDVLHLHGLYRVSGSREFQINLGMGAIVLSGHGKRGGFSMTMPVSVYPWRHWGGRFTPTWSWVNGNQINDYDSSVEYVQPLYSVRVGYRTNKAGQESLHGPYVGASYHY